MLVKDRDGVWRQLEETIQAQDYLDLTIEELQVRMRIGGDDFLKHGPVKQFTREEIKEYEREILDKEK